MAAETQETTPETPEPYCAHCGEYGHPSEASALLERIAAFCDRWEPVLERAEKFLHNPVGAYLKSPHRPTIPGRSNKP
jgi:hypothetical protein